MTYEEGDTIGITYTGERKVIDLIAEIEKIENDVVFFWVWNGCYDGHELLYEVFGDEYWYRTPKKPNHEYEYLCQIIKTVQAAFKELTTSKVAS